MSAPSQSSQPNVNTTSYRDRVYIIKDIIIKLSEYGDLNQTSLITFCGLNLKKHKSILDDMQGNGLISRQEISTGKRTIALYKLTSKGLEFCNEILVPYEKMFPRNKVKLDEKEKNESKL